MSRSRIKTPIMGNSGNKAGTVKKWKKKEHRAERKKVKILLVVGEYDSLPDPKEYGNEWAGPRDGKQYFGYIAHVPCTECWLERQIHWCWKSYKEYMRK